MDPNTRGWVPFTHPTNISNTYEHSNSFNTQENSRRKEREKKNEEKEKVKRRLFSFFSFALVCMALVVLTTSSSFKVLVKCILMQMGR
jgi:hypothetical protein